MGGRNFFRETLNKQLTNPEFKAEWDALEPEYQVIQAMLQGCKEHNLTQKRLAEGLGMRLNLEFVPMTDIPLTSAKK